MIRRPERLDGRRHEGRDREQSSSRPCPDEALRLEANLAPALELGQIDEGRWRIVALTGGTSQPRDKRQADTGRERRLETILPDGTALGDIRYVLETDRGDVLTSDPAASATAVGGAGAPRA